MLNFTKVCFTYVVALSKINNFLKYFLVCIHSLQSIYFIMMKVDQLYGSQHLIYWKRVQSYKVHNSDDMPIVSEDDKLFIRIQ
jgi:hypothetical protein